MGIISTDKRPVEDFQNAVKKHGIKEWVIRTCSICKGPLKYVFKDGRVFFDSGCGCVPGMETNLHQRTWNDVAGIYNMQVNPEVIEGMNKTFHFE